GYALLRQERGPEAARAFASVLSRSADYVPARVGAAAAALRAGNGEAALQHLRRAAALDSANDTVRRRLSDVRLQVTERRVAAAREAMAAGNADAAIAEYRSALDAAPEVTEARLALADLLVQRGQAQEAATVLEADPQEERQVLVRLGEILAGLREYGRALEAYRRVLALDPRDEEGLRRSREVREALELLQMPEEYRRIPSSPTITRADLAALIMSKVTMLSRQPPGRPGHGRAARAGSGQDACHEPREPDRHGREQPLPVPGRAGGGGGSDGPHGDGGVRGLAARERSRSGRRPGGSRPSRRTLTRGAAVWCRIPANGRAGTSPHRSHLRGAVRRGHRQPLPAGDAPAVSEGHRRLLRERRGRLLLHDPGRADQGHDPRRRRAGGDPLDPRPRRLL